MRLLHITLKNLDDRKYVRWLLIDFEKDFNKVYHTQI